MGDTPKLRILFHDFVNGVAVISTEPQTFALLIELVGLEKTMEGEKRSLKERIDYVINIAQEGHKTSCTLLKSITDVLDKAGVGDYRHFSDKIAQKLEEIADVLRYLKTKNQDTKEDDLPLILAGLKKISEETLLIKEIYLNFRKDLIARELYYKL